MEGWCSFCEGTRGERLLDSGCFGGDLLILRWLWLCLRDDKWVARSAWARADRWPRFSRSNLHLHLRRPDHRKIYSLLCFL